MKKRRKLNPKYKINRNKETGDEVHEHILRAEKKYGFERGKIPKDFVVHHIDEKKKNNAYWNIILIHKKDHKRLHKRKTLKIESVQPSKEKKKEEGDELEAVVEKKGEVRLRKR